MRIIIEDHKKEMADERWVSYDGNLAMMMMVMMLLPTLTLLISILAMHRSASIESKWEARESITLLSATPTWPKSCEYLSGLWLFFFFKIDDDDDDDGDDDDDDDNDNRAN